ncbi:MAG: tetratricopeptide repeat protein [Deltaproteobacteria bacterium]|jgi:tetratricopeptide (TPR) repeat protein|nr:tetratricopeptide repeat protein [Deltaproteobacteria bacterium]
MENQFLNKVETKAIPPLEAPDGTALGTLVGAAQETPGEGEFNHVLEGERLFELGLIEEAKELFQAALDTCPGNVQAWNNLAVAAVTQGDNLEAKRCLRQAIELKPDFLEARFNLAEIHCLDGKWPMAAKELQAILSFRPEDLPTLKRLAHVYVNMGQPDKAKKLLDNSDNVAAMKAFVDSLWLGIKFFTMAEGLTTRERLEKLMLAVLKLIDGQDGRSQVFRLVGLDSESGREICLQGLSEHFYYQEPKDLGNSAKKSLPELVLAIGENEDWEAFRERLRNEMRAEGGCLGDFTQTKKVLRSDARFAKYDLEATLKYFKANVGPCDCHVLRAVLV